MRTLEIMFKKYVKDSKNCYRCEEVLSFQWVYKPKF